MWFAMHVKPGCEEQAVELLRGTPKSALLDEVFCPMAECERRDHGEMVDELRPMIDGVVFVVAAGKREVRTCARQAEGLEAMRDGHPSLEALATGEEEFVNLWAAPVERICAQSEGWVDSAGNLTLEGGPLFERQDAIRKFSRDRRLAFMETSIAGKPARAKAGVRITRNDHARPWDK